MTTQPYKGYRAYRPGTGYTPFTEEDWFTHTSASLLTKPLYSYDPTGLTDQARVGTEAVYIYTSAGLVTRLKPLL